MESEKRKLVKNVRELDVYQLAFSSAMGIFTFTKSFPSEEKFSLTDQIRRSSRSVCSNLAEGWHKRRYHAAFISKLKDAEQEAAETQTWLEISKACGYISQSLFTEMFDKYEHIIAQLLNMERLSKSFCQKIEN
jgi:four helix bundle protein